MIVREKRADIVGEEGKEEREQEGRDWYGCHHRVLRWKRGEEDGGCKPRAPGCYEEGQWKFDEIGVLLC